MVLVVLTAACAVIDCGHQVCPCAGIQSESSGDPRHLTGRQHQPKSQQTMIRHDHEPRHKDGCLQKGGQTQADDLFAPLCETVDVAAGDAEHIQRPHCDLD